MNLKWVEERCAAKNTMTFICTLWSYMYTIFKLKTQIAMKGYRGSGEEKRRHDKLAMTTTIKSHVMQKVMSDN